MKGNGAIQTTVLVALVLFDNNLKNILPIASPTPLIRTVPFHIYLSIPPPSPRLARYLLLPIALANYIRYFEPTSFWLLLSK